MAASGATQLLERDEEISRLESLLDAADAGSGRLAVVEGPAGIGKTELVANIRGKAAERGMGVFAARASDLESDFAYGVVRQLFDRPISRDRQSLLAGVASYASPIFASPTTGEHDEREGPPPSPTALLHGLFWLVGNLSEGGPLLVAIDDAQWADVPSLRFVYYLGRRLDDLPVAVVLAVKPIGSTQEVELLRRIAAEPTAVAIRLRPLTSMGSRRLLGSLLAADPDDRFAEACYSATGGNPLLLRELAGALKEDGVAPNASEARRVDRLVPEAVVRHVLVRLSRLPPSGTALARAAAVLGGGELRHAAVLAGVDEATAAEAFDGLVSADILAPGHTIEFAHPLLREVVYTDTPSGERAMAHRRAARVLAEGGVEAERIASQLLACEPFGEQWAVEVLRKAARDAHGRGATHSAVTYLSRALAEPPPPHLSASVLHELGLAETNELLPQAPDHLAEALRLTPDPARRAAIAPELVVALQYQGRAGEAVEVLEQTVEALGDRHPDLRFRLEAHAVIASTAFLPSRRALRRLLSRASAGLPDVDSSEAAPLLSALAMETAYSGDSAQEAIEYAQQGLAANERSTWIGGALERLVAAEALMFCDRLSYAEAICDELIGSARAHGATVVQSSALTLRAHVLNRKGQILDAEADARLALQLAANEPFDFLRPYKLSQLVLALIDRGETSAASRLLSPREISRHEPDQSIFQLVLRDTYARLLRLEGRFREALVELEAVELAERDWGIRNPGRLTWRETAALVHNQRGDAERAAEIAQDELRAARRFGAPRALGIALRTAALVADDGVEQLREAVAVLETSEARLEHARTLVELGSALRRAGHRTDAREPLRTGLELADRCGARSLANHARQELLASGARPRRARSTGREALTPSEWRTASMAADGLTNREIAQTLYLSLKTVEMHLSRTYRKLEIGSRTQLRDALALRFEAG